MKKIKGSTLAKRATSQHTAHITQTTTHLQLPPSLAPSLPSAAAAAINDVRQRGVRRRHHPGPHVSHWPSKDPARDTILVPNPISMTVDMGVAMRRTRTKRGRRIRGWLAAGSRMRLDDDHDDDKDDDNDKWCVVQGGPRAARGMMKTVTTMTMASATGTTMTRCR